MQKLSKYVIFHRENGKNYIFHQMSKALLGIDDDLFAALSEETMPVLPDDIFKYLKDNGFIVDDDVDESYKLSYANIVNRYNSKHLRLTILPTINCNFRCWYCYEQHEPSLMTDSGARSVLEFAKSEIESKHIECVTLDWFGGEPLLRFSQIIYPFTKSLKGWCEQLDVKIQPIMTTNGSLINDDVASKMDEIGLNQLQITLDGDREHHNKVRFSPAMRNSYDVIVGNIHTVCKVLKNPSIELRINYTKDNIDSAFSILDDFDKDIRRYILVSPHVVWQRSNELSEMSETVSELRLKAFEKGYNINIPGMSLRCMSCYTENMEQFVINYDMNVYKCTARDFDKKYSIGRITDEGKFVPNELYYKYYITSSPFMNKQCLECELLPSCIYSSSCLQKKVENHQPGCEKNEIMKSIHEDISFKLNANLR